MKKSKGIQTHAEFDPAKMGKPLPLSLGTLKHPLDARAEMERVARIYTVSDRPVKDMQPTKTQLARRATALAQRAAVIAAGGKSLTVLLDPKHAKLWARALKKSGKPAKELLQELIARNA